MTYFFAIRVVERHTIKTALAIAEATRDHQILRGNPPISAILVPPDILGLVIVEAEHKHEILKLLRDIKHTRGLLPGKLTLEEVLALTTPKVDLLEEGTIIQIISGPLKQCEGRVINDDGNRVIIEVLDWERENRITVRRNEVIKKDSQ